MKRLIVTTALAAFCSVCFADVTVKMTEIKSGIKPMNAVNNGPILTKNSQVNDNFEAFKDLNIPYVRTHDAAFCESYGGENTVDIRNIFPDFSKDENDPASYDFLMTDYYLWTIHEAGSGIFFRLGQKIEHWLKKDNIMPPEDYAKWARICEHIIRHYNCGWANGYYGGIKYWEIWNEADNDTQTWKTNPICWGGPKEEFFKFYEVVSNHLHKCFPELEIGGPALCWDEVWAEDFLKYMSSHKVKLDFFSWHIYHVDPSEVAAKAVRIRRLLDKYGYGDTDSILDEWNYIRDFGDYYPYSVKVMNNLKGAAYVASVFQTCQNAPVEMLMYYDIRPCVYCGLFDLYTFDPKEAYYAFYAWSKLSKLGKQLNVTVDERDVYATAATDLKGRTSILVSRYNEDNNVVVKKLVKVCVPMTDDTDVRVLLTDSAHKYTDVAPHIKDGVIELNLEPNSFAMIEIR